MVEYLVVLLCCVEGGREQPVRGGGGEGARRGPHGEAASLRHLHGVVLPDAGAGRRQPRHRRRHRRPGQPRRRLHIRLPRDLLAAVDAPQGPPGDPQQGQADGGRRRDLHPAGDLPVRGGPGAGLAEAGPPATRQGQDMRLEDGGTSAAPSTKWFVRFSVKLI